MKKLKQAKAEAKTDLEKLTTEHELKYKDIEVFRFRIVSRLLDPSFLIYSHDSYI